MSIRSFYSRYPLTDSQTESPVQGFWRILSRSSLCLNSSRLLNGHVNRQHRVSPKRSIPTHFGATLKEGRSVKVLPGRVSNQVFLPKEDFSWKETSFYVQRGSHRGLFGISKYCPLVLKKVLEIHWRVGGVTRRQPRNPLYSLQGGSFFPNTWTQKSSTVIFFLHS